MPHLMRHLLSRKGFTFYEFSKYVKIYRFCKESNPSLATHDKGDKASEHGDFHEFLGAAIVLLVRKNQDRKNRGREDGSGNNQE